jgi:hypothetical protein
VEQPVVAPGRARREAVTFEERHPDATQGEVVGEGPARAAPADDHDVRTLCMFHAAIVGRDAGPA